ncbi:hypothetical protein QR680_011208 [Steinernema hermaphroditum]|uniref:RING-CH-type domain-containing protein n=1 Tax=Steinernema hermaphroditum TaxID=289476 RepID=A0AA39ISN5_9BILA|nr:hypothetical protein QR680_011208 [Steinernema hermaphroditum]
MDEEEASCRICYAGADDEPLYSPCRCSGTAKYIHQTCWERLCEHRPRKDDKCDLCLCEIHSQEVEVDRGLVTRIVLLQALNLYFLEGLFRVIMISSFIINSFWQEHFSSITFHILCRSYRRREETGKWLFGEAFAQSRLPSVGKVHSREKIRNVTSWQVVKHDGTLAAYFIGLACAFALAGELLDMSPSIIGSLLWTYVWKTDSFSSPSNLTSSYFRNEILNLTSHEQTKCAMNGIREESFAEIIYSVSSTVLEMMEYWWQLIPILAIVMFAFITRESIVNVTFSVLHSIWLGFFINSLIMVSCTGWLPEIYMSLGSASQYMLMLVVGYYFLDTPATNFLEALGSYIPLSFDSSAVLHPFRYQSYSENVKSALKSLFFSHFFMVISFSIPLTLSSCFMPSWLFLGDCLHGEDLSLGGKRSLLGVELGGVNMMFKVIFVVHYICNTSLTYDYFFKMQDFVSKEVFEGDRSKPFSSSNEALAWSFVFSCFLTLYFCFLAFLGRSLFFFGLVPSYFDVYQNDLFAHLTLGFTLGYLFFLSVGDAVKYACMFIGCLSIAFAYSMFFESAAAAPLRAETVFIITWMFTEIDLWEYDNLRNMKKLLKISSLLLYCSIPAHIIKVAYGYSDVYDAYSSDAYILFWFVSLLLALFFKCVSFLTKLTYHLKYEYGEIVKELVNYERSQEGRRPLKQVFNDFIREYRNWSVYKWLKDRYITMNEEEDDE